jgi:hypothetical protein
MDARAPVSASALSTKPQRSTVARSRWKTVLMVWEHGRSSGFLSEKDQHLRHELLLGEKRGPQSSRSWIQQSRCNARLIVA